MDARKKLRMARALTGVQRIKRSAAEASLAMAKSVHDAAQLEEQAAREGSRAAREDWLSHVSGPRFSPEFLRSLSLRLVARQKETDSACLKTQLAAGLHTRREREWQQLEAQTRSGEESLRKLRRKVAQGLEEERLGRLADLVTHRWSRS
jgi:hypothetical protein